MRSIVVLFVLFVLSSPLVMAEGPRIEESPYHYGLGVAATCPTQPPWAGLHHGGMCFSIAPSETTATIRILDENLKQVSGMYTVDDRRGNGGKFCGEVTVRFSGAENLRVWVGRGTTNTTAPHDSLLCESPIGTRGIVQVSVL